MNNFEKIKTMTLDEMAMFFETRQSICELKTPCKNCQNAMWCECSTKEDFKKWLEKEQVL